jgi:hypothetical protein
MDTAAIYRHARTASSVYHAVLRGELTSRLGVSWTPVTRGVAEIDGIPPTLLRLFSQRRQQIVETMRRRGTSGVKAAHAACLDTRPAKRHDLPGAIRDRWAAAATVVGFSPPQLGDVIGRARTRGPVDQDLLAAQLFGPEGVTADKTTFTRQDLAKAICEGLPAGMPIRLAALDQLVAALIRHPEVVAVASRDGCERRYTTRELLLTEQAALATATTPAARPVGIGSPAHYALELDLAGLSDEQAAMVGCLTGSGRRVDVVAGPAGAGKTAGLAAAYRIWVAAGLPVQGAAVSWLAAQQLEATTGITSSSLATTLHHADRNGLPTGVILVLDEASLVNTRTLDRLQRHVVAADGKLVVVGDPHQLPEIGAGGLFAALAARPEAIQLTGNQRQQAAWERDALRQLRDGDPVRALAAYTTHHRVHTEPDSESLSARIAVDYVKHIDAGADVLVLAARRSDVSRLNHAIRGRLIDSGRLGAEELSINTDHGIRGYRVGDRVIVTVNDRHRGLVNGSRGAISSLDPSNTRVRIDLDDGHHATIDGDSLAAGALAHGYAATVHKAQGLTVDITLVCGLGPLTREHGYVALSRGRTANHLYVASDVRSAIDCGPPRPTARQAERALTAELVERLRESRSQRLASLARPDDRWSEPDRYADDHDRSRGRSR